MPLPARSRLVSLALLLTAACRREAAPPAAAPAPAPAAPAPAPAPETAGPIGSTTFAPALAVDLHAMTRTPSGLYLRDLAAGTGPAVQAGQLVEVHYAGSLPNGTQFDANGPADRPFAFHPGRGEVIRGWDEGVVGMRVGGRRQLVIPPALGYGAQGTGPIPPNAILVFTVEVVRAQ